MYKTVPSKEVTGTQVQTTVPKYRQRYQSTDNGTKVQTTVPKYRQRYQSTDNGTKVQTTVPYLTNHTPKNGV
jgi:hypothetical protein